MYFYMILIYYRISSTSNRGKNLYLGFSYFVLMYSRASSAINKVNNTYLVLFFMF
jgi:hypothetical protein